ncbi:MAG: hypothetical protein ABSH05_19715 [Bryobacteraceae bacterium]|jgi:hypothetical protein
MNFAFAGAAALAVLAAIAFFFLFRQLISRHKGADADLEWCRDFSIARYRPMERLFVEDDYDFLAAQPGFHPRISRKLQAERRRVFRHYLRCLRRDFDRLSAAAKTVLVHAAQDRPDLATTLLKQRMVFSYAMLVVEFRLALQTLGIGRVDVRRLVTSLEAMRDQLRQLTQHAQPSEI